MPDWCCYLSSSFLSEALEIQWFQGFVGEREGDDSRISFFPFLFFGRGWERGRGINENLQWDKSIFAKTTGIAFKYHALRRTHLTFLANQNIPVIEVMNRAGHKKFETTMKYYVNRSEDSRQHLLNTLNAITTEEQVYEIKDDVTGEIKLIKESDLIRRQKASAAIVH